MANKKGASKVGGRVKGTPNRKTEALMDRCQELGVDPFEILLLFAKGDWKALGYDAKDRVVSVSKNGENIFGDVITPEIRANCAKEACQYIHPKRKALEHSNADDVGFKVILEDYTTKK